MSMFDTNIDNQTASMFGAPPAPVASQENPSDLGFGLSLDDLSPIDRYKNLITYSDEYAAKFGDTTYRQELKAAREAADAVRSSESNIGLLENGLMQVGVSPTTTRDQLAPEIEDFRGSFEDYVFGATPDDRPLLIGSLARAMFMGRDSANRSAGLQQLTNQEALDAREQLEGQGQVSNYEGQLLASAQNTIGTRGTNPEDIARQVINMRSTLDAAQYRNRNNIRFDQSGREWIFDRETGKPTQRVVTIPDPATGQYIAHPIDDPTMEVVAVTDRGLTEDDFMQYYYNGGISDGTWVLYNGQSFQKGADNDPYKSR